MKGLYETMVLLISVISVPTGELQATCSNGSFSHLRNTVEIDFSLSFEADISVRSCHTTVANRIRRSRLPHRTPTTAKQS